MNQIRTELEIQYFAPSELTPYAKNAAIHSDVQIDEIAGQIAAFGFDQPIVVDANRVIIKGHGRREAAIRLNLEKVPCIVSTLDEYQAMASRIADNKVALKKTFDNELLSFDLGTLDRQGFDLKLTGIDEDERKSILDGWNSDLSNVQGVEANLDGITATIKVRCPQSARANLMEYLRQQVADSGFEGVTIE